MRKTPTVDEVVDKLWPYDGPHPPARVRDAAAAVPLLVRYLNNATGPWNARRTLPYAADVDGIVTSLAGAAGGLRQLLEQLGDAIGDQARHDRLYDERDPDDADLAAATANAAQAALIHTCQTVDRLHHRLSTVAQYSSRLGDRVAGQVADPTSVVGGEHDG